MDAALTTKINTMLTEWHQAGRASFEAFAPHLDYDTYATKHVVIRRKYALLDEGPSGAFIVDIATQKVYRLKSKYGTPNKKKCLGTIGGTIQGRTEPLTGQALHTYRWW